MHYLVNLTNNFFFIAFIIIGIYATYKYFSSKKSKSWFNKLSKAPDLSIVFIYLIVIAYPLLFLSLIKDWFGQGKDIDEYGEFIFTAVFKQLHVDKDDPRRSNKVFFIGWGPMIGLHLPLLLLWIAIWVFIVNFVLGFFI